MEHPKRNPLPWQGVSFIFTAEHPILNHSERPDPKRSVAMISLYSAAFMGLLFIAFGVALYLNDSLLPEARAPFRNYAAIFLMVWGIFRIVLFVMKLNQHRGKKQP
jgi:hypothetical protein